MQGLAKLLLIEDDDQARINLSTILEFVGEQCEAISSDQLDDLDWSDVWAGCIVGSLVDQTFSSELQTALSLSSHIPLLIAGKHSYPVEELTNYVGDLEYPLNYPQLSEALRFCKDFLGRKGISVGSERKNTLFRSLVGQSLGIFPKGRVYIDCLFTQSL